MEGMERNEAIDFEPAIEEAEIEAKVTAAVVATITIGVEVTLALATMEHLE